MKLGKRYLLTGLLGLALAVPIRAQNPANGPGGPGPGGPAVAPGPAAFNNNTPPPPPPVFCPPGETVRNIVYPFGESTDAYHPVGNAFYDPKAVEGLPAPAGGTNAPDYYLGLGGMALRRTSLEREVVAELAPPLSFTHQDPVDLQAVPMPFLVGVRGEFGINFGPGVLELSGFYLFSQNTSYSASATTSSLIPSALFGSQASFANFPIPAGFNPALWAPANSAFNVPPFQVTLNYALAIGNLEMNYRMPVFEHMVFLVGLRYFDTNEHLDIQTLDNAGSTDYAVGTRSRIVGPQAGFEFELPLIRNVSVELNGKAAGGANFFYVVHSLTQGNGVQGPGSDINGVQPSGVFELGLFTNIWFNEHIRLHVGYEIMYILNVPEAQSQVNFNTTVGAGTGDYHGSYFFQGPVVEMMWTF